jgi:hypothetical protein
MAVSIVCYSNTGNNLVLAEHLADLLQCGIAHITETRRRGWLRTMLDVALGRSPRIEPMPVDLRAYRHVVLIGPVWASRLASPLRTFLAQHRHELDEYSFITLCGYANPGQKESLTDELTRRVCHAPRAICELPVAQLLPRRQREQIRIVTPYRISDDDMADYDAPIAAFLQEAGLFRGPGWVSPSAEAAPGMPAEPAAGRA